MPPGRSRARRFPSLWPLRTWLFGGLAIGVVFALAVTKVTSPDAWVHLSLGRWMAENGQIARTNLLSHTMPDRPTLDHQWLFQLGLYGLWSLGGIGGAIVVKAAVVAGAFALVLATARRKGADVAAASVIVLVAAFAARFRFTLRPQVVAFVLLAAYLYLLERWRHGDRRGILLLIPLQVVWANVHGGSAILGLGLAVACAAGESVRAALSRRFRDVSPAPRPRRELLVLWGVAFAVVLATLASPGGIGLLKLPFALAAAQARSGLRPQLLDRASIQWADLGARHLLFAILALCGLATLVGSLVRKDVTEAGLFVGLLVVAFWSERFVGEFAVAAAPIAARNLSALIRSAVGWQSSTRTTTIPALVILGAVVSLGLSVTDAEMPLGLGAARGLFPEDEVAFVQREYPNGNLYNEFEHGGYIHWRTRRPVFLDSRGLLAYGPEFVRSYVASWDSEGAWARMVDEHQVVVALVPGPFRHRQFRAHWRLVFPGMVCNVFVRRQRTP